MGALDSARPAAAPEAGDRPNVLCFPSPSTTQFIILVASLVTAGLFVGNWVHNLTRFHEWADQIRPCTSSDPWDWSADCVAAERLRVGYALAGSLVAVVGGAIALAAMPRLLIRRHNLRPLPPQLAPAQERFVELANERGLRRAPQLLLGDLKLRDAFSLGVPGRYRVALPPRLAVSFRSHDLFDPTLRHELAHIARKDVTNAWLAIGVWWVLIPLILLPAILALGKKDVSLLSAYTWRALALLLVVRTVTAALLRLREHEADLGASRTPETLGQLRTLVGNAAAVDGRSRWRRILMTHPTPAERVAVLDDPARLCRVTFLTGLSSGFLTALSIPLLKDALNPAFYGWRSFDLAYSVPAAVAGSLLGMTVGWGTWRWAFVSRVTGENQRPWWLALGVALGLVVGDRVSLAQMYAPPEVVRGLWLALAGAGATAAAAGIGEVWADAAPRLRRAPSVLSALVGTLLFSSVVWAVLKYSPVFEYGSLAAGRTAIVELLRSGPVPGVAMALTLALALVVVVGAARAARGGPAPAWLTERGGGAWRAGDPAGVGGVLLPGLGGGIAGGAVLIAYRMLAGAAISGADQGARVNLYFGLAGSVAVATVVTLSLTVRRRGAGIAMAAAPLSVVTVIAVFIVLNTALGGILSWPLVSTMVGPAMVIGFLLSLPAAAAGLLPIGARRVRVGWTTAAVTAACLVVGSTVLLAGSRASNSDPSVTAYVQQMAQPLMLGGTEVDRKLAELNAGAASDPAAVSDRIGRELDPLLDSMLSRAQAYQPETDDLAELNALVIRSLTTLKAAARAYATFYATGSRLAYAQATQQWAQGMADWGSWRASVAQLAQAP